MTLREFGNTSIQPTVPRASGACASAISFTASTRSDAASKASRRNGMGVGPACASTPVSTTSYQRWPRAAVTTPITVSAASSTGPCSICASKYAPTPSGCAGGTAASPS
ncbi:hypothetical protein G6F35_018023 [Rhizopus arrhizus]|nr:hypothetical protein G6F35_018023 [Rhizopus arrhizus]